MTDHSSAHSSAAQSARSHHHTTTAAAARQPADGVAAPLVRTRALRALRIILPLHVAAVLLQSVSAGLFFSGRADAITLHAIGGPIVLAIGLAQLGYAARLRRRGNGPAWFLFASLGIVLGELLQGVSGHNHIFWFHVPMGVLLFGGLLRQHQWIAAQPLAPSRGAGAHPIESRSPGASPIEA